LRTVAIGVGLFVLFYGVAWTVWFLLFTGGDVSRYGEVFVRGWSGEGWGLPLLIQVFALGTAIISTWALHALDELDWF
jgi:hypothetical protein